MSNLIKYEAACRAVALAKTVDEVKNIMDKSKAIEAYGRQAKNRDIEADGFEIRMRAERRLGEMLREQPMNKGTAGKGRPVLGGTKAEPPKDATPTLSDLGIEKKLSSRSQKTAALPKAEFEKRVAVGRDKIKAAVKAAHVFNNSGENEWYTPKYIIDAARAVMGSIDLDPASSAIANKTVKAKLFYDKDGQRREWGGNVWMNPPYSQPLIAEFCEAWLTKWQSREFDQGLMLVNNATETNWLQPVMKESNGMCFIKGRVKFVDKEGKPGGAPLQGQLILYFGDSGKSFGEAFGDYGVITFARPNP